MPAQYSHTVCSYETVGENNFKAAIKLKLSSEVEAKRWLDEFKRSSGFLWRTSKTYPNGGRYNKFRVKITTFFELILNVIELKSLEYVVLNLSHFYI